MAVLQTSFFRERRKRVGDGAAEDVADVRDFVVERDIVEAAARAEFFEHEVVRLVEDDAVEVLARQSRSLKDFIDERRDGVHSEARHAFAVHVDLIVRARIAARVGLVIDNRRRVRHLAAAACRDDHRVITRAVRAEDEAVEQRMVALDRRDERRRAAVAEERADDAVLRIDVAFVDTRREEQDILRHPCLNEALCHRETIGIGRASEAEVEGARRLRDAELVLHDAGRRRHEIVRRLDAEQDKIDVRRLDMIRCKKRFGCTDSDIARRFIICRDMALRDADFFADRIRRIVLLDRFRQIRSDSADSCIRPHQMSPSTPWLFRRSRIASTLV